MRSGSSDTTQVVGARHGILHCRHLLENGRYRPAVGSRVCGWLLHYGRYVHAFQPTENCCQTRVLPLRVWPACSLDYSVPVTRPWRTATYTGHRSRHESMWHIEEVPMTLGPEVPLSLRIFPLIYIFQIHCNHRIIFRPRKAFLTQI